MNFQILLEMEQSVLRKNAIANLEHGSETFHPEDRMKTKGYRERHAIITQILGSIDDSGAKGASRTSIMYKTFLSYTHLKEYLSFFLQKGLIEEFPLEFRNSRNEKLVYKITEKGLRVLQIIQEIERIVGLH